MNGEFENEINSSEKITIQEGFGGGETKEVRVYFSPESSEFVCTIEIEGKTQEGKCNSKEHPGMAVQDALNNLYRDEKNKDVPIWHVKWI